MTYWKNARKYTYLDTIFGWNIFDLKLIFGAKLFGRFFALQNCGEAEWLESITNTLVEFAHELDPEIYMKKTD